MLPRIAPGGLMAPSMPDRVRAPEIAPNQADLTAAAELTETGKVIPVIDRTYPLAQAAEAIRHLEQGQTRGRLSSPCKPRPRTPPCSRPSCGSGVLPAVPRHAPNHR